MWKHLFVLGVTVVYSTPGLLFIGGMCNYEKNLGVGWKYTSHLACLGVSSLSGSGVGSGDWGGSKK